jgi:hypothetical protein
MNRVVRRSVVFALVVLAVFCVGVAAQQPRDATGGSSRPARRVAPPSSSAAQNAGEDVDENFELNIAERRITERDFFASTSIETEAGAAHGLSLRVGVAVGASEIDVLLRNVQGRVRFRGSLEALRRVLDARREPTALTPAQPSVP